MIQYVVPVMKAGVVTIVALAATSVYFEEELNDLEKRFLLNGFFLAILVPSFLAAGAFMHESQTTWSNGEIHWHADFEVLVEDDAGNIREHDLIDPKRFCEDTSHESTYMCKVNDRTGSTEYHEHNDDRIHVEGAFKNRVDASLGAFFDVVGGELTNGKMSFPTNDEDVQVQNTGEKTLKILVQKGVGASRQWCAVGEDVPEEDTCRSHGVLATSPDRYIISSYTQNPANSVILDNIFIVYDSNSVEQALQDVREDGRYRGKGFTKEGGSYG